MGCLKQFQVGLLLLVCSQAYGDTISNTLTQYGLTDFLQFLEDNDILTQLEASENNYTILAPTNAALAAVDNVPTGEDLVNLLNYHILNVSMVTLPDSTLKDELSLSLLEDTYVRINTYTMPEDEMVTTVQGVQIDSSSNQTYNIIADNAIIHTIPAVLTVPTLTIYQYLEQTETFSTFFNISTQLNKESLLNATDSDLTVFIPNNDALTTTEYQQLLDSENFYNYHILNAALQTYYGAGLYNGLSLATRHEGENIIIVKENTDIFINSADSAKVLSSVFSVKNGVIHEINAPLEYNSHSSINRYNISITILCTMLCALRSLL